MRLIAHVPHVSLGLNVSYERSHMINYYFNIVMVLLLLLLLFFVQIPLRGKKGDKLQSMALNIPL